MAPTNRPRRGEIDYVAEAADYIGRIAGNTANQKTPTQPIYDSTNFPDDAVDGQLARDASDLNALWQYQGEESGGDNAWHKIGGGGVDYLHLVGSGNDISSAGSFLDRVWLDETAIDTNDSTLWDYLYSNYPSAGGRIVDIYPQRAGLYIAMFNVNWGAPTGAYRKTTQITIQTFGAGFTSAWVTETTDTSERDQMGQTAGLLGSPVPTVGPASGIASGQIFFSLSHLLGGGGTPVHVYGELIVLRHSVSS